MPKPSVWGPNLWKFLHTFASKCGSSPQAFKKDHETQAHWILANLDKIIPCSECVAHYITFKHSHPIPKASCEHAKWFWDLHDSVNTKLEKQSPPFDSLVYTEDILTCWKEYVLCVEDSIQQNFIRRTNLLEFQRHLQIWLKLLI